MRIKLVATAVSAAAFTAALAGPASGHDLSSSNGCDVAHDWVAQSVLLGPEYAAKDRNGDGAVCQGKSNQIKDNHVHNN